jgi:hypothetical protein
MRIRLNLLNEDLHKIPKRLRQAIIEEISIKQPDGVNIEEGRLNEHLREENLKLAETLCDKHFNSIEDDFL